MTELSMKLTQGAQVIIEGEGPKITTDVPKEVGGSGEFMSPTDLLAASLGSCVLTMMSLFAKPLKVDISGTKAIVVKSQGSAKPGHIGKISIEIHCPHDLEESVREKIEKGARSCPVHHSLIDSIEQTLVFHYG